MANDDAWSAGWQQGSKAEEKKKKGKSATKKKSMKGESPDTSDKDTGGKGGGAWSTAWKMMAKPGSFKEGGKVRKTGYAKVHKGEKVLTAAEAKACRGKMGKSKGRARKKVSGKSSY